LKVNAAQQQQSLLTVTAPKARAAANGKAAESGENTFRSTMERAEQNAAAAAKPGDAEQPQAEEVQPEDGLNAEGTQEETTVPAEPGREEAGSAMEGAMSGIVESILPTPEEEDGQAEAEELILSMGQAAALQQQPEAMQVQIAPEAQQEVAQQAAEGVVPVAVTPIEGQGEAQVKAQPGLEQQNALQEEAANAQPVEMNSQITAPEANAREAGMETATRQEAEGQNIAEAPKQEAAGPEQTLTETIFAAQARPDAVLDIGAAEVGEPLPEAEAGRLIQQSLLEQVQTAVTTGKDELFIQLKPETLGGLVIQLTMTEEGLKAQVRTANENVQNMVTAQIGQLEDALKARDIPVVQMEVIYDPSAGNGFLQERGGRWQEGDARQGRGGYGVAAVDDPGSIYEAAVLAATVPEDGLTGQGVDYSA